MTATHHTPKVIFLILLFTGLVAFLLLFRRKQSTYWLSLCSASTPQEPFSQDLQYISGLYLRSQNVRFQEPSIFVGQLGFFLRLRSKDGPRTPLFVPWTSLTSLERRKKGLSTVGLHLSLATSHGVKENLILIVAEREFAKFAIPIESLESLSQI